MNYENNSTYEEDNISDRNETRDHMKNIFYRAKVIIRLINYFKNNRQKLY